MSEGYNYNQENNQNDNLHFLTGMNKPQGRDNQEDFNRDSMNNNQNRGKNSQNDFNNNESSSSDSSSSSEESAFGRLQNTQYAQDSTSSSSSSSSSSSDSDSSSSSSSFSWDSSEEENWQQRPNLNQAPSVPFEPVFIGNQGNNIQSAKEIQGVSVVKKIAQMIGSEMQSLSAIPGQKTLTKYTIMTEVLRTMNAKQIEEATRELYFPLSRASSSSSNDAQKYQAW